MVPKRRFLFWHFLLSFGTTSDEEEDNMSRCLCGIQFPYSSAEIGRNFSLGLHTIICTKTQMALLSRDSVTSHELARLRLLLFARVSRGKVPPLCMPEFAPARLGPTQHTENWCCVGRPSDEGPVWFVLKRAKRAIFLLDKSATMKNLFLCNSMITFKKGCLLHLKMCGI